MRVLAPFNETDGVTTYVLGEIGGFDASYVEVA